MSEINSDWKTAGSFIKELGNAKLEIAVQLFMYGLDSPIRLKQQNVLEIQVVKDIEKYFSKVVITIKDQSNLFALKLDNTGKSGIALKFKDHVFNYNSQGDLDGGQFDEDKIFDFTGIITEVEVISMDATSSTIKVTAYDTDYINFNKITVFSSGANSDISNIIKMLLVSSGYEDIINDSYMKPSNNKMFYITDVNTPLNEHISYLLNNIIDDNNGFAFLWKNTVDKQLRIVYSKEILKAGFDSTSDNIISITSAGASKTGDSVANTVKIYAESALPEMLSYFKSSNIISFDLIANRFVIKNSEKQSKENNNWTYDRLSKSYSNEKDLTIAPNENFTRVDNVPLAKENKFIYHISNKYEFVKNLRDGFLTHELIAVTVPGRAWRNPGELYVLLDESATTGGKLSGKWFCCKIVDIIGSGKYEQVIFLCRSEAFETDKEFGDRVKNTIDADKEKQ